VANFDRSGLGMVGAGHFSPVVAYNPSKDLALVLDVARYKYPPFWVPLLSLFRGIDSFDESAQVWVVVKLFFNVKKNREIRSHLIGYPASTVAGKERCRNGAMGLCE